MGQRNCSLNLVTLGARENGNPGNVPPLIALSNRENKSTGANITA